MSYTFDNLSVSVNQFPVPLQTNASQMNPNLINNSSSGNNTSTNNNNNGNNNYNYGNNPTNPGTNSKILQSILRNPSHFTNVRDRDYFMNNYSRAMEENARRQRYQSERRKLEQPRGRPGQNVPPRMKNQKCAETWDSNINLVSNSNSENESSLSLNSITISPNSEANMARPKLPSAYGRERLLVNQRSSTATTNNNSNSTNLGSNSSSIVLSLSEFRNNDNNNNSGRNSNFYLEAVVANSNSNRSPFHLITESFLERNRQRNLLYSPTINQDFRLSLNAAQHGSEEAERNHFRLFDLDLEPSVDIKNKPRHYYKLQYTPWNYIKIRFDRLELIALLDRNLTIFEVLLSLFLSIAVSVCGIILLNYGFYRDLFAFLFCITIAGCQYSLLKSVQPDATSPTHGYNRVVIYSRSIYFCMTSLIIILLTVNLDRKVSYPFVFYNVQLTNNHLFRIIRDGLVNLLLFFPVLFTLGLFPQINTFCLYLLEQIDMHVFGGNAMSSLVGAVYCITRSIITVVLIYGFAYGALSEVKGSQHILFSIFSGLLISLSYHLSRSSSNPTIMWNILKNHLFQDELMEKNHSKQFGGARNKKNELDKSVDESIKSDKLNKEQDDKSEDKNSRNNLLLNSNPSSNETLKTVDTHLKSNFSENFDNSGNGSEIYNVKKEKEKEEFVDPLPGKLKQTVNARLKNDVIVCSFVAVLVFGIHCSTVFTALQPDLNPVSIRNFFFQSKVDI